MVKIKIAEATPAIKTRSITEGYFGNLCEKIVIVAICLLNTF
ncbi:MAG TPA: hypothetical protein PKD20_01545 [Candidatus Saccharibacteria bacterium]|jgi:hypothetical protein|nr:hypothetical protein [Candidatus Saccharibacteria bacterium]